MTSPSFSLVIPTRNRADVLSRAIEGALNQSHPVLDVVVVDDASSDNTKEVVSRYPTVTYIKNPSHSGGNFSRNRGVEHARGTLIGFCDDDDCWKSRAAEKMVKQLIENKADIAYCGKMVYNRLGRQIQYSFKRNKYPSFLKSIYYDNFIGSTSSVLIKKEWLTQINGFDETLPGFQDWDLYIRLIEAGALVTALGEPLIEYHIVREATSISWNPDTFFRAKSQFLKKYQNHRYLSLLRRALLCIQIKRSIQNRHFFFEMIKHYLPKR